MPSGEAQRLMALVRASPWFMPALRDLTWGQAS